MLEKGKDYKLEEFLSDQLAFLYAESRKEETTTKEKLEISLVMVTIFRAISEY